MDVLCKNCQKSVEVFKNYQFCPYCGFDFKININGLLYKEEEALRYHSGMIMVFMFISSALLIGAAYYLGVILKIKATLIYITLLIIYFTGLITGGYFIGRLPKAKLPSTIVK